MKLIITVIILLIAKITFAVCLEGTPSIYDEYAKSYAVFIGRPVSVKSIPDSEKYYNGDTYTVQVLETFKGKPKNTIAIFNENSSGRFPMGLNKNYILFVYKETDTLQVNNCGNSGKLPEQKYVVDEIKNLQKVEKY